MIGLGEITQFRLTWNWLLVLVCWMNPKKKKKNTLRNDCYLQCYLLFINILSTYNWSIFLKWSSCAVSADSLLKWMEKVYLNLHGLWTTDEFCQLYKAVWHHTVSAAACTASDNSQLLMPQKQMTPARRGTPNSLWSNLTDHPSSLASKLPAPAAKPAPAPT